MIVRNDTPRTKKPQRLVLFNKKKLYVFNVFEILDGARTSMNYRKPLLPPSHAYRLLSSTKDGS
tara:strand:- start:324 stop:515 length:192 start_codon:yes stop_codon:yes gene_type:complete